MQKCNIMFSALDFLFLETTLCKAYSQRIAERRLDFQNFTLVNVMRQKSHIEIFISKYFLCLQLAMEIYNDISGC